MLTGMRRITVRISDELEAWLRHEGPRRGETLSELTRQALEAYVGAGRRRRLVAAAAGASGQGDVSARVEEILAGEGAR
jgi:hypothetical protein